MDDLKPVLKLLLEALQSTSDFAMAQAPLVLREMIWWGVGAAVFWWAFWWVIVAVFYFWLRPAIVKAACGDEDDEAIANFVFRAICSAVLVFSAGANAYVLVKIWLAPRLYLIEKIGSILNGNR